MVSAVCKAPTIQVFLYLQVFSVEDFEAGVPTLASYSYGATIAQTKDMNMVKYGKAAAAVNYTIGADGNASMLVATPYTIGSAYTQLSFWMYGDNSGSALTLVTSDGTNTTETPAGNVDFTRWKQITVALPTGTVAFEGLKITQLMNADG